jgi:hypothetical protein
MSTNQGPGNHLGPTTPSPLTPGPGGDSSAGSASSASTFDLPLTPATPNDPSTDSSGGGHSHGGPSCSAAVAANNASSQGGGGPQHHQQQESWCKQYPTFKFNNYDWWREGSEDEESWRLNKWNGLYCYLRLYTLLLLSCDVKYIWMMELSTNVVWN